MIELILELVLSLFGEALIDLVVHAFGEVSFGRRTLRIILFAAAGAIVGGLSLLVFPDHFIRSEDLRLAALVLTPIVAGSLFTLVGRRRLRKGKPVSALEAFWPAFALALAMALVRHFGAG